MKESLGVCWALVLLVFVVSTVSQVDVIPSRSLVSAPGHDIDFRCLSHELISSVTWLVNDSHIDLPNVEELFFENGGLGILILRNIQEILNMTRIRCRATFNSRSNVETSPSTLLLLQDLPSFVTSLYHRANLSHIHITWIPPMSLDVTGIDYDDLTYCVNVSSGGSMQSFCGISEAEFVYPLPPVSWCDSITFTVAAVNLAGRGPSSETVYVPQVNAPQIDRVQCALVSNDDMGKTYEYTITMTSPVCSTEVSISDNNFNAHPDVIIAKNSITFTSEDLDLGRSYDVTVLARNVGGSATSQTNIHTSDVVGVNIHSVGELVECTVSFCENATADGVLLCFLFVAEDGDVDFNKSVLQVLDRNESLDHSLVFRYDGRYRSYAYDIADGGTFVSGIIAPAVTNTLSIDRTGITPQTGSYIQSCDVSVFLDWLEVKCVVSNETVTGIQVTAQSTEMVDVGTLYTNHSSEPQAKVTVQVGSAGMHHVSVFPILGERGILDTSAEHKEEVMVGDMPSQGTTTADVITTAQVNSTEPPSSSPDQWIAKVVVLVVVVVVVVAVLVVAVLVVIMIVCVWRRKHYKLTDTERKKSYVFRAASPDTLSTTIQEPQQNTSVTTPQLSLEEGARTPLLSQEEGAHTTPHLSLKEGAPTLQLSDDYSEEEDAYTNQLSQEEGYHTPQLSPKEYAQLGQEECGYNSQLSPEEGAPTPQLRPEEGAPTPQLSPEEGTPTPQLSPEERAPTPQVHPEEGAPTSQLSPEEGPQLCPNEYAQLAQEEGCHNPQLSLKKGAPTPQLSPGEHTYTNQNKAYSDVVSSLPSGVLELPLDSGPGIDENLLEIAESGHDWNSYIIFLGLTLKEICDIKEIDENTVIKRKEALKKWVDKQAHIPTYGDFLKLLLSNSNHPKCVESFCELLAGKGDEKNSVESLCHPETEQLQAERLSADDCLFYRPCLETVPRPFCSCGISGDIIRKKDYTVCSIRDNILARAKAGGFKWQERDGTAITNFAQSSMLDSGVCAFLAGGEPSFQDDSTMHHVVESQETSKLVPSISPPSPSIQSLLSPCN